MRRRSGILVTLAGALAIFWQHAAAPWLHHETHLDEPAASPYLPLTESPETDALLQLYASAKAEQSAGLGNGSNTGIARGIGQAFDASIGIGVGG